MGVRDEEIVAGVLDALPLGVWVARAPKGEFVYANPEFARILGTAGLAGVARGEYAEPYAIHDRSGALYPEHEMPFVRALEAKRTVMVDDIVIHHPEGTDVYVRAYARPVLEGGEVSHVVIAFFDISREVEAENARKESEQRARQAERMKSIGTLAGGIAHDFNNLLAAIRILADTLRGDAEGEPLPARDRRQTLDALVAATDTAADLSRSLLAFAGHGSHRSRPIAFDLLVGRVGQIFRHAIDRRIELQLDLDCPLAVEGDPSRLEQLVLNLVINAEEALAGDAPGRLWVRSRAVDGQVVMEVEDDGPGVPPELRSRIFEPYYTSKSSAAAGFGLATVYSVVEAHGGHIEVLEGAAGGALFRVTLPATERVVASEEGSGSIERGNGLVLVVDDDDALRDATETALRTLGYSTLGAPDGMRAGAIFREHHDSIAAVVLDMSMPKMGGAATYMQMRSIDRSVRVLLTTGYGRTDEAEAILDLGVRDFLQKPWTLQQLSAALMRVLRTP